jgi:hypothetical protein
MRRGVVAFANEEDRWSPEDEEEVQDLVAAEAPAEEHSVGFRSASPVIRMVSPVRVPLWELVAQGRRIKFRDALMVELAEEDGEGVLLENKDLRIWGMGKDAFAALEDFSDTFVAALQSYESTPDHELSSDAREYLRKLRALIA